MKILFRVPIELFYTTCLDTIDSEARAIFEAPPDLLGSEILEAYYAENNEKVARCLRKLFSPTVHADLIGFIDQKGDEIYC